jgi:hypothetical protein
MSWNYRLVKLRDGTFGVREVYYNKNSEAWGMTKEPVRLGDFESMEEVRETMMLIQADMRRRPVFEEPDKWAKADHQKKKIRVKSLEDVEKALITAKPESE